MAKWRRLSRKFVWLLEHYYGKVVTWRLLRRELLKLPLPTEHSQLVTFDVFDTLLTRLVAEPDDVHEIVARSEFSEEPTSSLRKSWASIRKAAELGARAKAASGGEITIQDIYREAVFAFGLSESWAARLMAAELDVEAKISRPIAYAMDVAAKARAEDRRVGFISDMYLPKDYIRALLLQSRIEAPDLWVSSATGTTKSSGKLFAQVAHETGLPASACLHFGDHFRSDFLQARRVGWTPHLTTAHLLNRYEKGLYGRRPDLLSSVCAGVARATRLGRSLTGRDAVIWNTSADVVAPLLVGFVLWTLSEASRRGQNKVFYLARDGQILSKIAGELAPRFFPNLTPVYTFASRRALLLASLDPQSGEFANRFSQYMAGRSPLDALKMLDMSLDELDVSVAFSNAPSELLDRNTALQLAHAIEKSAAFRRISQMLSRVRTGALKYFADIGLLDSREAIIVDLGWRGNLQKALNQVLQDCARGHIELTGLYFGLREQPSVVAGSTRTFVEDASSLSAELLELFCAADHGSVLSYRIADDGSATPVLASAIDVPAAEWGVPLQQEAVQLFASNMTSCLTGVRFSTFHLSKRLKGPALLNFEIFRRTPSYSEASAYGSFLHAADLNHLLQKPIAPTIGPIKLARAFFSARKYEMSYWPEGSLVRSMRANQKIISMVLSCLAKMRSCVAAIPMVRGR